MATSAVPVSYENLKTKKYLNKPANLELDYCTKAKGTLLQDPKTQRLFVRGEIKTWNGLENKISKGDFPVSIGQGIELPSRRADHKPCMRCYYVK